MTDHHICINPRLWKEAFLYEKLGYEVVILSMWQSNDLLQKDFDMLKGHKIAYKPFLNLIPGEINSLFRFLYRLRKRMASELQKWFGIGTSWAISHAPERMYRFAIKENADLYAAHLECAFYVGKILIKSGKKVCFDFEDWYSRDYLTPDRAVSLLMKLERFAIENGVFCTAASKSMAHALKKTYDSKRNIEVVYNTFPNQEEIEIKKKWHKNLNNSLRIIWTSRTVGPNRGLETFIQALHLIKIPVELHLIGKPSEGYVDFLKSSWPKSLGHELIIYDFIPHNELLSKIACCDIGLAIEQYEPENKNVTIANKIMQYLQAGIKVIATDTLGQKEVAEFFPESLFLVSCNQPLEWANKINKIAIQSSISRSDMNENYKTHFSWQRQEDKLILLIKNSI